MRSTYCQALVDKILVEYALQQPFHNSVQHIIASTMCVASVLGI